MSLLVHPDKCSHPQAHQAFIKLNKAFKELQDPDKVSLLGIWFIIEVKDAVCGILSFLAGLSFCDIHFINYSTYIFWDLFSNLV